MPKLALASLDHLDRMTDSTGLIQHAIYGVPRRDSGYTVDDNARALRLCVRLWRMRPERRMLRRISRYLSLLEHAKRPGSGFHNLMSYQRQWLEVDATDDCQGQAVRALADVVASPLPDDFRLLASELIDNAMPALAAMHSPRAQAYVILAYGALCDDAANTPAKCVEPLGRIARKASEHLRDCYRSSARPSWNWFEETMTYANAVLPHALFTAAERWPDAGFMEVAMKSFEFLDTETTAQGIFWPVGNSGWYARGGKKSGYDQQPIEAVTMADASLAAFGASRDPSFLSTLARANAWFHGQNSLESPLVDLQSGGCCDGLSSTGVNRNRGAESTLAYLWTTLHHADGFAGACAAGIAPPTGYSRRNGSHP